MGKEDVLKFCSEKSVLLDNDLLKLFSETKEVEIIKLIIEQIKNQTKKRFITKEILISNKDSINNLFLSNSFKNNLNLRELKLRLGLNLEISAKSSFFKEKIEQESFVKVSSSFQTPNKVLEVKDFIKYFKNRFNDLKKILQNNSLLNNLISINKINGNSRNFSIIGMVCDKRVSKNKNIILEVEDFTGRIKILISNNKEELYKKAEEVVLDSVLGFKCSGNSNFLFANDIVFPETNLPLRKKSPVEEYALFMGDLHYGSKNFMEKEFLNFIKYLNEGFSNTPEVKKIKYLFLVGDILTGVGNYPNQERDLKIVDLEEQFQSLANVFKTIRKDIKIIICPGNHDGVRLMEPQPLFNEKYAWPLYELNNVILVSNPSYVNIASREGFEGFEVLLYHGFSYPYYINNVPSLMAEKAADHPEKIVKYLLKNSHLAPFHGSVQYYPLEKDSHLIRKAPDIFVSGHLHKSGVCYYNNILIISASSWETKTPYQEKFGNTPDYCKVPIINLKTREIKILDFETKDELINEKKVEGRLENENRN